MMSTDNTGKITTTINQGSRNVFMISAPGLRTSLVSGNALEWLAEHGVPHSSTANSRTVLVEFSEADAVMFKLMFEIDVPWN